MTVELRDLTLADALAVVGDMRPMDAECVRAACGREPGEWFAVDRWQAHGAGWTLLQDGRPWAIGGLSLPQPWLGVLWLVARPGMSGASWRKAIRATRTVLASAPRAGVHRVEASVLNAWPEAALFASTLGLRCEGVRLNAGARGESIEMWARTARSEA